MEDGRGDSLRRTPNKLKEMSSVTVYSISSHPHHPHWSGLSRLQIGFRFGECTYKKKISSNTQ